MALLTNVKPGDLITADQWNLMVAAVQGLSGPVTAGTIPVPTLFGLTLGNALAIITLPSTQLAIGTVFDTMGNPVDPADSASKPLIVLNQTPAPSATVFAGTSLNLVVSPKQGSAPPPPKLPIASGFGAGKTQIAIGDQLEIDGQNFVAGTTTVTFDGTAAGTPAFPPSTPSQIFVVVPTGIPGAPTGQGQTKAGVNVVVSTPNGTAAPLTITILPPLANPLPTVTLFSLQPGRLNQNTTITGTGFDPTVLSNNVVNFDGTTHQTASTVASATQLTVQIPSAIPGVTSSGKIVVVTVTVKGQTSAPTPLSNYFIMS